MRLGVRQRQVLTALRTGPSVGLTVDDVVDSVVRDQERAITGAQAYSSLISLCWPTHASRTRAARPALVRRTSVRQDGQPEWRYTLTFAGVQASRG